jgi:hypothetical protein
MTDRNLGDRIADAITQSKYKWRTARSISKEIDELENIVFIELNASNMFVKSKKPNARGEPLFTTSVKYRTETSFLERFIGAAANTVSE